jgi:hypothetical protein
MSTYDWLLFLHVTGALLLTGGTVAAGALNIAAQIRRRPSEIALLLSMIRFAVMTLLAGALLTLVFGLWLVSEAPYDYSFGQAWVIAAIIVFLIGMALGELGGRKDRKNRKLAERLAAEGDVPSPELKARLRAPATFISWAAGLMPLVVLVLMIWKPGA